MQKASTAPSHGGAFDVSFFADVFRDARHYGVRDDLVEGGLTRSCGNADDISYQRTANSSGATALSTAFGGSNQRIRRLHSNWHWRVTWTSDG
jgi:hypothetical protein